MEAHSQSPIGQAHHGHFAELRKHNDRRTKVAELLEARRASHMRIERVIEARRQHRLRHGG